MHQGSKSDWRKNPAPPNDLAPTLRKEDYQQFGNTNSVVDGSNSGMTGQITMWPAKVVPTGWLECDGQELSVEDYPILFAVLVPRFDVITFDIGSDAIYYVGIEYLASVGDKVTFKTDGAFPTGISADTVYFIKEFPTADYAILATDEDLTTTAVLSGTDSGVHEMYMCPWADTAFSTSFSWTSFTIPNLIRSFPFSRDNNPSNPPESTLGYKQSSPNDHTHTLDASGRALVTIAASGPAAIKRASTDSSWTETHTIGSSGSLTSASRSTGSELEGLTGGVSNFADVPTAQFPPYVVMLFIIKT